MGLADPTMPAPNDGDCEPAAPWSPTYVSSLGNRKLETLAPRDEICEQKMVETKVK